MASLKNSPGQYCLEQQRFNDQINYLQYKFQQVPFVSKLPGLGVNAGNMRGGFYHNVLSRNASNIESNLFGIRQYDLTNQNKTFSPELNNLKEQEFFKTPRVFLPEPLVVQKYQRPIGPFGGE